MKRSFFAVNLPLLCDDDDDNSLLNATFAGFTPELQWWVIYTLLKTYSNKIVKSLRVAFNMLSALLA